MRLKKRYILRTLLICLGVLAVLASAFVAEQYYRWHICNFRAKDGEQHAYNIYAGATIDSVLNLIREDYDISSETDLSLHIRYLVFNTPEPGHYLFPAQIGDRELIERLKYGYQTPVRITWNNYVRTREELAGKVTTHLLMDSVTLLQYLEDEPFLEPYGMNKETSRCLFIPNTYEVYWNITPEGLFNRMQKEYNIFWNDARRAKADSIGLTPIFSSSSVICLYILRMPSANASSHSSGTLSSPLSKLSMTGRIFSITLFAPISNIWDFSLSVRFLKFSNSAICRFTRSVSCSICSSLLSRPLRFL